MTGTYVVAVDDDRDTITDTCKFNLEILEAFRSRSIVSNENEDAQNAVIKGFASQYGTGKNADPRAVKLFGDFLKADAKRTAYLKTHPLPPIPENPC